MKQNWRVQFSRNHPLCLSGHTRVKWSCQTAGMATLCNWLGSSFLSAALAADHVGFISNVWYFSDCTPGFIPSGYLTCS